jgi:iron complex transport system permease protein
VLRRNRFFFPVLIVLLVIVLLCAIGFGAVTILPSEMFSSLKHFFSGQEPANIYEGVFIQLRLPRVLLCAITGAILAVSGVLMQGLFRNPIVEPGLVGTSSGAALGASVVFAALCWPLILFTRWQKIQSVFLSCLYCSSVLL